MTTTELLANPYVGLRPFFEEDSLYFYGRESQTQELLEILRVHRFLGVVGSSGSGKSSLVRAGLLPGLLGGFLVQDRDHWCTLQMKPGDAPIVNLCVGLLKATGQAATVEAAKALELAVRDGHTGAVIDFLKPRLASNANLFLLVDQFEEVFAFRGLDEEESLSNLDLERRQERARRKAEAAEFVDLLLTLAEQRALPIYVVLTMRTDFLGDCDLFHGLPEALNRGRYLVPRMKREQLRDAVECPALLMEAQVASRLMDHLLNELGDRFDRLPLLQHALQRTWDAWQEAGGTGPIDLRHFQAAGELEGALDQDAEAAMNGLDADTVSRVFRRLTDTDLSQRRVRSPARISELVLASGADRATVEAIVLRFEGDGRSFLHRSNDGKPEDPRVDISHESLIRQWERLHAWVDDERKARDQFTYLARKGSRHARNEAALLQDPELQMALDWRADARPTAGWAQRYATTEGDFALAMGYLDASLATRSQAAAELEVRRRWKGAWNPVLVVVGVVIGLWLGVNKTDPEISLFQQIEKLFEDLMTAGLADKLNTGFMGLLELTFSAKFIWFVSFVVAWAWLNVRAERWHKKLLLPRVLGRPQPTRRAISAPLQELPKANRALDIEYASAKQRLNGFWLDALVQCGITLLVIVVFFFADILMSPQTELTDGKLNALLLLILVANGFKAIHPLVSAKQATVGMRRAGIYRTDRFGRRLSWGRAMAWYLLRIPSCSFYFLGFVVQPWTPRRQTFHDWAAGTVVLKGQPMNDADAGGSTDPTSKH